jgi:hypothetical protein
MVTSDYLLLLVYAEGATDGVICRETQANSGRSTLFDLTEFRISEYSQILVFPLQ